MVSQQNSFAKGIIVILATLLICGIGWADDNEKLLCHFNGSDGATATTDSSPQEHTLNNNNQVQLDTAAYKWGTAASLFDGTSDYWDIADSADWDIVGSTSQDYTVDFWVKCANHSGTETFISQVESGNNQMYLFRSDTKNIKFSILSGGIPQVQLNTDTDITDTDWHHIALCKVTSAGPTVEWGIYLDGDQKAYVSDTSTKTLTASLLIGYNPDTGGAFDGHIDELRIYAGNPFNAAPANDDSDTITVPTSEYGGGTPPTTAGQVIIIN